MEDRNRLRKIQSSFKIAALQAIKQQTGRSLHANESVGKRPLGAVRTIPNPVDGSIVKRSKPVDRTAQKHIAAAEQLVRRASDELRRSLSTRGADWDALRLG